MGAVRDNMKSFICSIVILGLISEGSGSQLGEVPVKSASEVGFTQRWGELSERERIKLRSQAGWKWSFPGEPKGYRERQEQRREEIMDLYHYQERLDNWVQYTTTRTVKNFTELGFAVIDGPRDLHERLKKRLHEGMEAGARLETGGKPQGIYGDNVPQFVNHNERGILEQIQPLHEEWAAAAGPLQAITSYGMRIYRRDASLAFHTDRVDTHVISSIFHIDRHYDNEDEPWLIEIEGHDGKRHSANLKPGQMLLYESAKCPHGRSTALKGDWYAALFSHFRPSAEMWPYTQQDIWLAVPPDWDAPPITHSGDGRWAGAFLTHDSMEVAGMPPRDPKEMHKAARLRVPPKIRSLGEDTGTHYQADDTSDTATKSSGKVLLNSTVTRTLKAIKHAHSSAVHLKEVAASRAKVARGIASDAFSNTVEKIAKKIDPFEHPEPEKGIDGEDIVVVSAGVVSAVAMALWCASGGTVVGLGLLCRRMVATKGRSLTRRTHMKGSD